MRTWWWRRRARETPAAIAAALIAVAVTAIVFSVVRSRAATAPLTVSFRFDPAACVLPAAAAALIGGALTPPEIHQIEVVARRELEEAYRGTRLVFVDRRGAFWQVDVRNTISGAGRAIPNAGHAVGLGPLGGISELSFIVLATSAIRFAPVDAPRAAIVEAIGRGIGRAAVHELAHQIVSSASMDTDTDPDSYEYSTFNRPSQYYGRLHWAGAWSIVEKRIGKPAR